MTIDVDHKYGMDTNMTEQHLEVSRQSVDRLRYNRSSDLRRWPLPHSPPRPQIELGGNCAIELYFTLQPFSGCQRLSRQTARYRHHSQGCYA